jgi:hypothetical protein
VGAVKTLMRIFSYVYHGLLALFLLAVALVTIYSGTHSLRIEFLPWEGEALTYWLLFGALFALLAMYLAWRRTLPILFLLWSVAVLVFLLRGYFLSAYFFDDTQEFKNALYLTGGALLATLGAWFQLRRRPAERQR